LAVFLGERSPRAAIEVADRIISAIETLSEHAKRGRRSSDGEIRELIVASGRDGYFVQYVVDPESVTVLRVFHGRERRTD
jgi:plasmid stabilization system protein ParE